MCAAKSPISELQELAVRERLPFPQYEIFSQGTGFKCIINVGKLSASAVAESKKRAKHLCAEYILAELQHQHAQNNNNLTVIVKHVGQAPTFPYPTVHVQEVFVNSEEPKFNAVGKLNELCSQNAIAYPSYEEAGIIQQKFVIRCKLLSQITEGHASTKKTAKQIAAKEMLSRVKSPTYEGLIVIEHLEQAKPKPVHNTETQEEIIKLFKQLSTRTARHYSEVPPPQEYRDSYPENKSEYSGEDSEEEERVSEEKLKEQLKQLDISYNIMELQKSPVVLILKTVPTDNHPQYTFMHAADSVELAVIGLLKKAVRDIKLMNA